MHRIYETVEDYFTSLVMYRHAHLKNSSAIIRRHQHPVCARDGVCDVQDNNTLDEWSRLLSLTYMTWSTGGNLCNASERQLFRDESCGEAQHWVFVAVIMSILQKNIYVQRPENKSFKLRRLKKIAICDAGVSGHQSFNVLLAF